MPRVNHIWEVKKGLKVDDIQGGWVGDGLGVGFSRCKLLYIGWINNKVRIRWRSRRTCVQLLLRELQNYNSLLNNH